MDFVSINEIITIRLFERLIAVAIGGAAIYFGYRLFLLLPTQGDSSGKIQLPGFSVILAKVGPGIFFAAFGAVIVYQSLVSPLTIKTPKVDVSGAVEQVGNVGSNPHIGEQGSIAARIMKAIQVLNCLEVIAIKKTGALRADDVEEPIREAKIALIEKIWDPVKWGDIRDFERWTVLRIGKVSDGARKLYENQLSACPR